MRMSEALETLFDIRKDNAIESLSEKLKKNLEEMRILRINPLDEDSSIKFFFRLDKIAYLSKNNSYINSLIDRLQKGIITPGEAVYEVLSGEQKWK